MADEEHVERLVPNFGYQHILMLFIAISIILLSLLLAGCSSSSPLIPGIFLISLYYQKYTPVASTAQVDFNAHNAIAVVVGDAVLQCRIGYFGICISPDGGSWLCSNNATALANEISMSQDPLNLIWLASQFKDMIVFPYLMFVSTTFNLKKDGTNLISHFISIIAIIFAFFGILLLATFPSDYGANEETDEDEIPFPSKSVSQVVICIVFIACVFVLVSVLWQHTASVAASIIAQDFGNGSVRSGVGTTAMVLGWFGFSILVLATLGLLILLLAVDTFTEVYT
ncbi:hypothetical protein OnM2_104008 [Erysiphe neolycopersici]|uniref:Membrane fusion mating protein FIG1 n=1 Tax=Erysiphe neolycopersici TaxID=212602 RepID=A0A420H813_9PEZI|nr:hypothetical protein OnM2_104008 [Erysiphe neolycopersici]